jgi:Flp pilus assembly secretin CpaC
VSLSNVVVVKEQLASQSLNKTTDSRSNAEETPDGFVSLAPPSLPESKAGTEEVTQTGGATPPPTLDPRWANGSPSAIIELESQSAKGIDIPGGIKAITVENEDVCRILHDAKTITLVGNQIGSTLVEIWTNDAKETPMLARVNVSQPWHKSNSKPTDVRDVKHAVAQAFPKANINIVPNADGTLDVRGTTDSEDSAKRILEIVRKVCLVPVKDKVTVSR